MDTGSINRLQAGSAPKAAIDAAREMQSALINVDLSGRQDY